MELKKIACETCGGTLEVNEKRTSAKCLVCGNSYFIKDSESCGSNLTALLIRAQLSIEEMDFAGAENTCERIEALNDELVELWLYHLLIEARAVSIEELYNTDKDYTESGNYTKAVYYAYTLEKDSYIEDLKELKNKRIEKLKTFINANPGLAESSLAGGEALSSLEKTLLTKKSDNDIYMYDKTEYLHHGILQFYNVARLKFELNNQLGLFKGYALEGRKIKKCYIDNPVIDIPFGVTEIESRAFSARPARAIIIPESVKSIGRHAFLDCNNLVSVIIPHGVEVIAAYTFIACEKLVSVTIPASVTSIEEGAFAKCVNLKSVKIPEKCAKIGEGAFSGCCGIPSLKIPDSVTFVGKKAFGDDYIGISNISSLKAPNRIYWGPNQTIFVNKGQSYKWDSEWNARCEAKIVYRDEAAYEEAAVAASSINAAKPVTIDPNKCQMFLSLCSNNKLAEAKAMWEQGGVDLNFSYAGNTPLLHSVNKGYEDMALWLIKIGASVDVPGGNKKTALIIAASKGQIAVMTALLKAGANANLVDRDQHTALFFAIYEGRDKPWGKESVTLLLSNGADPNVGRNALDCSIEYGFDITEALIAAGVDIHKTHIYDGSLLIAAIKKKRESIAITLIENGADVDLADHSGFTPLHYAAMEAMTEVARLLLKKGAKANCKGGADNKTPLDYATRNSASREIAEMLSSLE